MVFTCFYPLTIWDAPPEGCAPKLEIGTSIQYVTNIYHKPNSDWNKKQHIAQYDHYGGTMFILIFSMVDDHVLSKMAVLQRLPPIYITILSTNLWNFIVV